MAKEEWRIFEIKSSETEWICARTNIEALQHLTSVTDIHLSDLSSSDEIREVPREEWQSKFVIMDVDADEEEQEATKISFADWMETKHDGQHPDYIASTAF